MVVELIFGPPGTGKTTELMRILQSELLSTPPDQIAYVSFTKEGAYQGRSRAMERFGFHEKDFPYFRTLHSIAFQALGLSRSEVIGKTQYRLFSERMGMTFSGYYTEDLRHDDDLYLFFDELYRNNARAAKEYIPFLDVAKLRYVRGNYFRFKKEKGIIDYTDMIETFCSENIRLPVKVAFIDEAQDLTSLQWKMIWLAFRDCERVYIAGDDDQAIYQWSGADVDYFLSVEGKIRVLKHSYRLPDNILRFSKRITKQISKRVNKDYEGIGKNGVLEEHNSFDDIPLNDTDTYMILSRNNTYLFDAEQWARSKSLVYTRRGVLSATKDDYSLIYLHESCRKKGEVTPYERSVLSKIIKNKTAWNAPWYDAFNWDADKIIYYRDLIAHNVHPDDVRMSIGTIHSSKGSEADHVILLLDITRNVLANLQTNPDSEHRVFYVGCTRAKKSLHIIHSRSKYAYPLY